MLRMILLIPALLLPVGLSMAEDPPGQNRADGYMGIWFTLGQFSEYGDKYSGGLGTYTANHIPIAVHAPEAEKTFFVYGGTTGPEERHLLIMASWYDHRHHRVPKPTIVHDKQGVDDPHDNPSLAIDPEGHLWIFISGRGSRRPGYIYRSSEPYSTDRFERISEREMTYPQPWWVEGRGFLHLYTRYTRGRELYFERSPDGRTWSEERKLAGIGGHYQVSSRHNGKIGTFFNRHPDGNVDRRTDLYYLETVDFGESWRTAGGVTVDLPLDEEVNDALVIDYSSQNRLQYTVDLNWDRNGNPILLYVTSGGHEPGPMNEPRFWEIAHWDGDRWRNRIVTRSDHNYDMGSLYVSEERWLIIAPTAVGPQPWGTGGEIEMWESRDEGENWTKIRQVTSNSERNHMYLRRPTDATDPFFYFWADGDPDRPSVSSLYFGDSGGERYWKLPRKMEEEFAEPVELRRMLIEGGL